jgi:hypothetical protein
MGNMRRFTLAWLIIITAFCQPVRGQTSSAVQTSGAVQTALNSFGPEHVWSDQFVYGKWRIQRNELTGHCRLLDPENVRRASGNDEQCRAMFAVLKRAERLPPLGGKAVLTLHGLGRTRNHMNTLGQYLETAGNYTWINVSYASTRCSLDEHAASLANVVEGLDGCDEIHFVCHSLGNLVVRRYLGEANQPEPRWRPDPRIGRMVMIGPPNNGAQLARVAANLLNDNQYVRMIIGPSAWQLARQWDDAQKSLATPGFEFGVIAGGFGDYGLNPLLNGDDDLVVTVAETRLPSAADFRVVQCRHGGLLYDKLVHEYVLRFIQHGYFTAAGERQPIAAPDMAVPMASAAGQ